MSEPSAPERLRGLLKAAGSSGKAPWKEVVRLLRIRHKDNGLEPLRLKSWGAVQSCLDAQLSPVLSEPDRSTLLASLVASLQETGDRQGGALAAAVEVDRLVDRLLPTRARGPVSIEASGWPPGFGPSLQARLLRQEGPPPWSLPAGRAAALVREFHGRVIAGYTLELKARLDPGWVLPPVPRGLRARPPRRGRTGPWLPCWDEEGRGFLTPRPLACRQAERFGSAGLVIDGCCGLGGNTIAFAEQGMQVIAVETNPARLDLARRNAEAMGVGDRVDFREGRIEQLLPELPRAPLFLDPPWGDRVGLPEWMPLPTDRLVVLKAPSSFDPASLPGEGWAVDYEFGEQEDDWGVLKLLTLSRKAPRSR